MQKEDIVDLLEKKHQELFNFLRDQDEDKWETGPEGKWTTGQHTLHLLQSIKLINSAMSLPKFVLKLRYGKSNRNVRDYQHVVQRYKERLKDIEGKAVFGPSKNMKVPNIKEKEYIIDRLQTECKKLQYKTVNRWNDSQLDNLILPHPLMGKMPVRELVMWTAYHTEHHCNTLTDSY